MNFVGRTYEFFFSRFGFTDPARVAASDLGATLVDLAGLDAVLAQATHVEFPYLLD